MINNPSSIPALLDFRVIFLIPLQQFLPWLLTVLLASWAGYPGVACITPMAWLIAVRIGNLSARRSRSAAFSRRLIEAALAGGLFGLLQGILFAAIVPLMGPIQADEVANSIILILIMLIVGIFAGSGLSFLTANLHEQRRKKTDAITKG